MENTLSEYYRYLNKCEMLGIKNFEFTITEEEAKIMLVRYIPNKEKYRTVVIPDFVDVMGFSAFDGVEQPLKIIWRNNKCTDLSFMFSGYQGEELDVSDMNTRGVVYMISMFSFTCNLKRLKLGNMDTSNVIEMNSMFEGSLLEEIDLSNCDMSNVMDISKMFSDCYNLKNIKTGELKFDMPMSYSDLFSECISLDRKDKEKWIEAIRKSKNKWW